MIRRKDYSARVRQALARNPVVALLGPRQCGKTTLARQVLGARDAYFDLENPADAARLAAPLMALEQRSGLVVLDEIQRRPDLLEILRVLVDRPGYRGRFLVLGSAAPRLMKGVAETLAGRVAFVDLSGFDLRETGAAAFRTLWLRGGFPRAYLAANDAASLTWRNDFIRTFLERDIPQLGITIPAETLRRFWTMVAHYHGQTWNAAEFARSLGSAEATARRYLDILSGAYLVRQLQPWHVNLKKRQLKSPKVYVRDSGLLHALLTLGDEPALLGHTKLGASWEGFVIEQILACYPSRDVYCWATYAGAELDLLLCRGGQRYGFEIKYTDAPGVTKSMRIAQCDLNLDRLFIVHPGTASFPLDKGIEALALSDLPSVWPPTRAASTESAK